MSCTSSLEFDRVNDKTDEIQEVELKVLPLLTQRFKYIIEVALKLLSELRNPKTIVLGMMLSYNNMMNPSTTLLGFTHPHQSAVVPD